MLLRYFYDEKLAHASYLIGCQATGEALVIDPNRDVDMYLRTAEANNMRIVGSAETHIHADFVSGSREIAERTGAALYLSDEGDENWKYQFHHGYKHQLLKDGDEFYVGKIKLTVMHSPGHTPEHISFILTDTAKTNEPLGIFTGDFVFVGDIGRPDLLEEAAGICSAPSDASQSCRIICRSGRLMARVPRAAKRWAPYRRPPLATKSSSVGRSRSMRKKPSSKRC